MKKLTDETLSSVVITGVSTGIGYATAKLFTEHGIQVFGSVRNQCDAERVKNELGEFFTPLLFDITDSEKVKIAAQYVREKLQGKTLAGLINNAGIAVSGPLLYLPLHDFEKQLQVNLTGQLIVIQEFCPLLGSDLTLSGTPGKIINISSVSGKHAYPFLGAYAISKHGLEAFSESLRRELMIFGIDVIIVGPGVIKTPIWEKAKNQKFSTEVINSVYHKPASIFKDYLLQNEKSGLPVEEVAKLLLTILKTNHPKIRYSIVPRKWMNWTIPNLLPRRFIDRIIAKVLGLNKIKSR